MKPKTSNKKTEPEPVPETRDAKKHRLEKELADIKQQEANEEEERRRKFNEKCFAYIDTFIEFSEHKRCNSWGCIRCDLENARANQTGWPDNIMVEVNLYHADIE